MGPYAYLALIGAGQALALGIVGRRRRWPLNPFGDRRILWFSASLLLTLAAYFQALRWGPVGPVAAIHLSTPLLLLGWEVAHRRRRPTRARCSRSPASWPAPRSRAPRAAGSRARIRRRRSRSPRSAR